MCSRRLFMWVHVALALSLSSCGGSESGGVSGGAVTPSAVVYTGNTAPATIGASNVSGLMTLAYSGPELEVVTPLAQGGGEQAAGSPVGTLLAVNRNLADEISRDLDDPDGIQPLAVISECSQGSVEESGLWDTEVGTLIITLMFDACVDGDLFLDGVAVGTLNGVFPDPVTQEMVLPDPLDMTMFMSYQNLNISDLASGVEVTVSGGVGVETSADAVGMIMDMVVRDEVASRTWKLEDYQVVLTDFSTYLQVEILGGRVFDPVAGYVDVSTPLAILEELSGPSQGVLRLDGAGGSWAEVDFSIVCDSQTATYNGSFTGDGEFCYP